VNENKTSSQFNKSLINAFPSPTIVQSLKVASTISNSYSNTGVSESLKRVMALTSKSNVYQNNFSDITSALTSYTAFTKQYSAITNIASSAQAIIKSTEALRKSPIFYNQSEISKMIANATRTNMQSAIAYDHIVKTIEKSYSSFKQPSEPTVEDHLKMKQVGDDSQTSTNDLKNNKAIHDRKYRQPTQTTGNNDVTFERIDYKNIEFFDYFQKAAQEMFDNGYSLPTITQMLIAMAISFTQLLIKAKSVIGAYTWLAEIIIAICWIIDHLHF
jgi:hypothetical protein